MNTYSARQYVELFHLLFLSQLVRKLDKRFYALKGGGNLRFFFKSQVISYLEPEDQRRFESKEIWDHIRLHVIEALGKDLP
ncbi:MAG: hypothetical protein ACE5QV_07925 [Fidelibacterota bacterium]